MQIPVWKIMQQEGHELVLGACLVLVSFMSFLVRKLIKRRAIYNGFPRGPPAWPILGHLPLLASACPHRTLFDLSHKHGYGPIIGLRLGSQRGVVISSASLAKEFLLTHDKTFATRPPLHFVDSLFYGFNNMLTFSSYGPQFSRLRKLYMMELFTVKRLHELEYMRQEELCSLIRRLRGNTQAVNMGAYFEETTINTVGRLLQFDKAATSSGHDLQNGADGCDSLPNLVEEAVRQIAPTLGDFIPFLKLTDLLQTRKRKSLHDRIDKILDRILVEKRQAMQSSHGVLPDDLVQVLLSKEAPKQEQELGGPRVQTCSKEDLLTTQQIKAIMFDILIAGSHTTAHTLEWAMAELLRNPRCLGKLRDEIDEVMGGNGDDALVADEDLAKLPYLESIVKEVLRLYPPLPLLLPRINREATKVNKYSLPAHTHVFVNVWALGRDPHVWEQAETFLPERFQGKDNISCMDVKGQHFDLLPFGSGRRICPGLRLGMSSIQVFLANLVKHFDWELPQGHTLDMSEKRGFDNSKATPLLVIPKPRGLTIY